MKLTEEELDLIDRYLEQRSLDFLDFKIEVKDHLACETEAIMETESLPFEEAFKKVLDMWKYDLQNSKTWIISNERKFPEIVANKIKNYVVFHYFTVILLVFVFCMSYIYLKNDFIQSHIYLRYFVGFCGISYLFLKKIMNQTKIKTSYRFHFEYFYVNTLITFALLFIFNINATISIIFGLILVADFPFTIYYFIKHQKFIKKYSLT